jgi:hypothetical protein
VEACRAVVLILVLGARGSIAVVKLEWSGGDAVRLRVVPVVAGRACGLEPGMGCALVRAVELVVLEMGWPYAVAAEPPWRWAEPVLRVAVVGDVLAGARLAAVWACFVPAVSPVQL